VAKLVVTARAIDMLGRQQVAGVPTAIHELFKNAHDADASRVEVDYWRRDALFLLRDDGVGMSRADFEARWLTVGTDSKLESGPTASPPRKSSSNPRPVLGEKGIGRLAIATIGPLVLALTKPRPEDASDGITAAMIHWALFEVPGLPIDRIEVPVETCKRGLLPGADVLQRLRSGLAANARTIAEEYNIPRLDAVLREVENFNIDLATLYAEADELRLDRADASGTHFMIRPADRIIEADIGEEQDEAASPLRRTLLGFSNTMALSSNPPTVRTAFRDHRTDGTVVDIIGDKSFFSPREFEEADHRVRGEFDVYGRFRGSVVVYGADPLPYDVPWPPAAGKPTECGPFSLAFAYIQGRAGESRLPLDEHVRISAKLNQIGGLYLYRDGVRMLPYGNSDYDFLDIERRRSKNAGRYFFSYRRMFGVIETSRAGNPGLIEKAGREGFKENRAYRQFKNMLENLLVQLAAEFFLEGGTYADVWLTIQEDIKRADAIRKRREKQARAARQRMALDLDRAFNSIDANEPAKAAEALRQEVQDRLLEAALDPDRGRAADEVLRIENEARTRIAELQSRFSVSRPAGVGLTKSLQKDWAAYRDQTGKLDREVFRPLAVALERMVGDIVTEAVLPVDRRRRLEGIIAPLLAEARKSVGTGARQLSEAVEAVSTEAAGVAREALQQVEAAIREIDAEFASTDLTALSEVGIAALRDRLTRLVNNASELGNLRLSILRQRLAPTETSGDDPIPNEELVAALEEQIEALREEVNLNLELAQVGMALGIVQHEFRSTVSNIRSAIKAIGPWANTNKGLLTPYTKLRSSFEHLDAYLGLFTPLDRRLHRRRTTFSGEQIATFLRNLFQARLEGSSIEMIATSGFVAYEVRIYPSTLLPVFVNLVDNALYWIGTAEINEGGRVVLDVDGGDLTVTDSGPGISTRDAAVVFDFGFTRRDGGRGLGLYISRQVLRREGWDLMLDPPEPGRGARFRLVSPQGDGEAESETE
jgi:signal transduction histidine kinase